MIIRQIMLAAAFTFVISAAAVAADLKIVSFSGPVTIKNAKGVSTTYRAGDTIPPIAPGDSISVQGGQAVFETKGLKITANDGASFTVSGNDGALSVTSNGGLVGVTKADGTVVILTSGQTFTSTPPAPKQNDASKPETKKEKAPKVIVEAPPLIPVDDAPPANHPAPPPPPLQEQTVVSPSAP
jgi:hypothetical protein